MLVFSFQFSVGKAGVVGGDPRLGLLVRAAPGRNDEVAPLRRGSFPECLLIRWMWMAPHELMILMSVFMSCHATS